MTTLKEKLNSARLYLVTSPEKPDGRPLLTTVEAALKGGVDIVQLRNYELPDEILLETACQLRNLTLRYDALFIVNNRPDIAFLSGADGVHVGQEDLPVFAARSVIGEGKIVGLSTHDPDQAKRAITEGADYIGVGPVFATPTKQGRPAAGLPFVTEVAGMNLSIPFFAIGGIDQNNLDSVIQAGATRISVVRCLMEAENPESMARNLKGILKNIVL
jgi:thiamine-phosphate pyrophosphorylase